MATVRSPTTSPPALPQNMLDRRADAIYSVQGRVPSQHTTNPRGSFASPPNTLSTSQLASTRYVYQYRALMDHQRKVFDEERDLWHTERSDLLEEISCLKARLGQAESSASSQVTSPTGRKESGASFSGFSGFSSASSTRHTSTGDEFWRGAGGKSNAQPTRTFSSPPHQPFNIGERLPSISENQSPPARRLLLTDSINGANRSRVPSVQTGGDIDGINFKSSSVTSSNGTKIMTPQSPSPLRTSPGTLPLPSSQLDPPVECNTIHAGHTPLARGTRYNTDGTASAIASSPTTPTQPEAERLPREPRASFVRPPSERSDSYFAGAAENRDEDHVLNEPLGLGNSDSSETQSFLEAVDSKLEEAAKSEGQAARAQSGNGAAPEQSALEHSEPEPKLRIKRSMNFGSQFGSLR